MSIDHEQLTGALKYLGFPSQFKINVADKHNEYNEYKSMVVMLDFEISYGPDELIGNIRATVDKIFDQLLESKPVEELQEQYQKEIEELEKKIKYKDELISGLKKYKDYYEMQKGLK